MQMSTTRISFDQCCILCISHKTISHRAAAAPDPKSTVSTPWHNFHLCPSSQQILATPLSRDLAMWVLAVSTYCRLRVSYDVTDSLRDRLIICIVLQTRAAPISSTWVYRWTQALCLSTVGRITLTALQPRRITLNANDVSSFACHSRPLARPVVAEASNIRNLQTFT